MLSDDIAPGDMVRVSSAGRLFHAVVRGVVLGGLEVDPIERGLTRRRVKVQDIVEHWSRAPRSQRQVPADREQRSFDDLLDR